jgi:hypothetical protein
VHSGTANGLVPLHPADTQGKTPLNLAQGVYSVTGNTVVEKPVAAAGQKWSVESHPPRQVFSPASLEPALAPTKVSRTILASSSGGRVVTLSRDSSIVYDAKQHSFVNSGNPPKAPIDTAKTEALTTEAGNGGNAATQTAKANAPKASVPSAGHANAPRPNIAPPAPPASSHSSSHEGGAAWEGNSSSAASSASSSHSTAAGGSHASGHH